MQVVRTIRIRSHNIVGHDINYYFRDCHNHDCYEFIVIVSGRAIHHVNDKIQVLVPGNLLFIRPNDAHYFIPYSENSDKYEFYNIRVRCEELANEYAQCRKLIDKIELPEVPPLVMMPSVQAAALQQKIKRMNEMAFGRERDYLYAAILKDVCFLMLDSADIITDRMPAWMKKLMGQIETKDLIDLDYLKFLEMSGVSKSYLSKSFKKYMNMSPTEYINNLKLEYAYELILTTNYSLLDISMMTGFNSYSYFFRLFSQKYKIAPNKIKKNS